MCTICTPLPVSRSYANKSCPYGPRFGLELNISETVLVRTKNQKSRLVLTVQAFCEEKGLRSLSGVFGYAESENQCWQAEKWLFIDLICIFSRWPPKTMELVLDG